MIRPNARCRLTPGDASFVIEALRPGPPAAPPEDLAAKPSLAGPVDLDRALDEPALLQALLARRGCARISLELFFYVAARRVLKDIGLDDRSLADYVASLLVEFSKGRAMHQVRELSGEEFTTIVDLFRFLHSLETRRRAGARETFLIHSHIGDFSLYLTGIFPDRVFHRTHARGGPPLAYYEEMGAASYRAASALDPAYEEGLHDVLAEMSEQFHPVRLALNRMSDRFLQMGSTDPLDLELRRVLYGGE